jgi:hypothetical protein
VHNFAASALSGYEFSSSSEGKMNDPRFSNLAVVLESGQRILRSGRIVAETITSHYKEFAPSQARANDPGNPLFLKKGANMNESVSEQPISSSQVVAAYGGIDWADHGARTFIDCTFP